MKNGVQSIETREAILDATDRLLARYGYKKMTIDDLAAEVGIGKGSIYLHFRSKEEIALSHIDRIVERMTVRLKATAADESLPIEERLRRMLLTRVLFRFDSVQHYTQSISDLLAALRSPLLVRREGYFQQEAEIFAALIEEGIRQGIFEKVDPPETAEAFLLATNSLLPYSLTTEELGSRAEIEVKALRLADLLLRGTRRF